MGRSGIGVRGQAGIHGFQAGAIANDERWFSRVETCEVEAESEVKCVQLHASSQQPGTRTVAPQGQDSLTRIPQPTRSTPRRRLGNARHEAQSPTSSFRVMRASKTQGLVMSRKQPRKGSRRARVLAELPSAARRVRGQRHQTGRPHHLILPSLLPPCEPAIQDSPAPP